jgi:predicted ATP-dependent endonuclease of OLD family
MFRDMRIERVRFERYRCLKDLELRLGALTALVGPNATGKSTLLKGLWRREDAAPSA